MGRMRLMVVALLLTVLLAACSTSGGSSGSGTEIAATLEDGTITLSTDVVTDGNVSIVVSNQGSLVHEFELFSGSNPDLPVSNGVADTSGMTMIDEVEDITPGANPRLDLDLAPGDYVIICNLPGHYQMGMVTTLTVTG
jgi:Copper binding proteins, plastocyanin/azurin family